jgi:hypothetical protein
MQPFLKWSCCITLAVTVICSRCSRPTDESNYPVSSEKLYCEVVISRKQKCLRWACPERALYAAEVEDTAAISVGCQLAEVGQTDAA